MGWDPTVKFVTFDAQGKRIYDITVDGKTYTTVSSLSDHSANATISRAGRVWRVKGEDGQLYVLKDAWIDANQDPEHVIQRKLLDDVEEKCGPEGAAKLRKHLFTHVAAEKVKIGEVDDDTTMIMMRGAVPSTESVFVLQMEEEMSEEDAEFWSCHLREPAALPKDPPPIRAKYHYRIVFQEHATTLANEKSLLNALRAIRDVVEGGSVHFDFFSCRFDSDDSSSAQDCPREWMGAS